jgi:hypothetical protein
MTTSQKRINLLLWSSSGIMTNILYIMIVLLILESTVITVSPRLVLEPFLPLVGLSLLLSLFIITYGLRNEKKTNWGLLWIAITHIPSLVGLILAFIHLTA